MPELQKQYIVSGDLRFLMRKWAREHNFDIPSRKFFEALSDELVRELRGIFEPLGIKVTPLLFGDLKSSMINTMKREAKDLPIISVDTVYVDNPDLLFDCTRIERCQRDQFCSDQDRWKRNWEKIGTGPRAGAATIHNQLQKIVTNDHIRGVRRVVIVDDGTWSRETLHSLEELLLSETPSIMVEKFILCIDINDVVEPVFDPEHPIYTLRAPIVSIGKRFVFDRRAIHDWICERDFYPGAPQSGRTVGKSLDPDNDPDRKIKGCYPGEPYKENYGAPYVLPLGNPEGWANIPRANVVEFSHFLLDQAIRLYVAIEEATEASRGSFRPVEVRQLDRPPFYGGRGGDGLIRVVDMLRHSIEILEDPDRFLKEDTRT
jgi:hypothetical protein